MPTKNRTTTGETNTEVQHPSTLEQLEAAYQVHTLAQMLYGRIAGPQFTGWTYPASGYGPAQFGHADPQMMGQYADPRLQGFYGGPNWNPSPMWPHLFGYQQFPR